MPSPLETIAPDALFITFPVTDGDKSRRPDNLKAPPLSAREVNWHRQMTMEEKYACRWRNLIGQGIAMLLNKPDKEKYCLKTFPAGYLMLDHNKGPIANIRHDLYLYGSRTVLRFRSPAEFIPHGVWLLTDSTLNNANCGCKYCGGGGKKSQTEISEALGLPTNRGRTAVTGRASTRIRTGAQRIPKPMKSRGIDALPTDTPWVAPALRQERKPDPAWATLSLKLKLAASIPRISDLRSHRRFRVGELVWCKWGDETHKESLGKGDDQPPSFWPAIVLDYSLESVVDPNSSSYDSYSVFHIRHYSLIRLGSSSEEPRSQFECIVDEDSVLPWQAHEIDLSSWPSMRAVNSQSGGQATSFTLALHAAQRLVQFWAVCNRLPNRVASASLSRDYLKMENSPSPSHVSELFTTPDHGANPVRCTPSLTVPYPPDSPPQRSPARLKPLSPMKCSATIATTDNLPVEKMSMSASTTNVPALGSSQPVHPLRQLRGPSVIESRYEGLWYGAERIWMGDVVRLCPERDAFSASLKLSHARSAKESWKQAIAPSPGAAMRGVLMRIDRIFSRVGDTGAKECAVAGPIYELAAMDLLEKTPPDFSSSHASRSSSASQSEPNYCPWDMPQKPLPRPNRDNRGRPMCELYPLPPAPPGYTLRPLLLPESEITFPVSFIAGRYYPDILEWSLSIPILPQVPRDISSLSLAAAAETRGVPLLSLCGLAPGRFNHAVCMDIRLASRTRMIEEATCLAVSQ